MTLVLDHATTTTTTAVSSDDTVSSLVKPETSRTTSEAVTEVTESSSSASSSSSSSSSLLTESPSQEYHDDVTVSHGDQQQQPQPPPASSITPRQQFQEVTFANVMEELQSCSSDDPTEKEGQEEQPVETLNEEYTKRVMKYAQRRLEKSGVLRYYDENMKRSCHLAQPTHQQLSLGDLLGQGSFSAVYTVNKAGGNRYHKDDGLQKDHVVVKILRKKLLQKPAMLAACIADLIKEGLLMATLTQPRHNDHHRGKRHILQVHGWTPTLLQGFANGRHDAFFLILQRLDYTLGHQLELWRRKRTVDVTPAMVLEQFPSLAKKGRKLRFWKKCTRGTSSSAESLHPSSHNPATMIPFHIEHLTFWQRRLQLIIDLAHAVEYLHSRRILHRDLKPDNIGFEDPDGLGSDTTNGVLKVFDFDVARILPEKDVSNSTVPLFQMTKRVGSPRYMSPECARGDPYNEKADVYTVGLLCYELLTLIKPYHDISPEQHDDAIFHNGARPALPHMMDHDKAVQAAAVLAKKMDHVNPTPGRVSAAKVLSQSQKAALVPAKQPHVQFWSASLRTLVQRMWNQNIDQRPSMEQARRALEEECHEISRKLQHLEAELERHWQEQVQQQHVDLEEEDVAVPEPAVVKGDDAEKPTRGFSLRLWKSSANNGSSSKLLNRSRHGSNRSRTSSMGGTSRTAGVTSTTGLSSSNFASFNNLAALNTLQEQQQ